MVLSSVGTKAKGIAVQTVLPPVPLPPGLKATPSSLEKVFKSDILVLPDTTPDAAGRCLTPAGFGSGLGCSVNSTTPKGKSQSKEESVVLARL